ncbi:hypothetical protein CRV15_30035 (plasmid) [Streptomyces clavuligerus]|nr:hypothetical protein SSCG_04827 [Streptomyces clavuligerus]QCS09845.1 hypothetical protein CRV15_30035 [Streptomyces clavuligerus]QPJ98113.1 hypothetical protein GE265_34400 [Streptomyces clavuligerus]
MVSIRHDDVSVRKIPFRDLRLADFTGSVPWRRFRSVHGQAHHSGRYFGDDGRFGQMPVLVVIQVR